MADEEVTMPDWVDQLPDDLKSAEPLAGFDGPKAGVPIALVKGYMDLHGKHGELSTQHEELSAAKAELEETRAKLEEQLKGYEPPEKYELEDVDIPEGVEIPNLDEQKAEFMETAKELKMSASQANGLWAKVVQNTVIGMQKVADQEAEAQKEAEKQALQAAKATEEKFKEKWGEKYNEEMAAINHVFTVFGTDEFDNVLDIELADGTKLGNHEGFVTLFNKIGHATADTKEITGQAGGGGKEETPEERAARMYPETPTNRGTTGPEEVQQPEWAKELYSDTGR